MLVGIAALLPERALSDQVGALVGYPGASIFISKGQIAQAADVPPTAYTLRASAGTPGQVDTHSGVSVRKLIQLAGSNPDRIGYLTVPRPDGTTLYMRGSDFAAIPPFPEGPALVWVDADSTHFFRPVRGADDENAADNIATVSGAPLPIGLHAGSLLTVHVQASKTKVRRGEATSLSADVTGEQPGETLSYRWTLGDGSSAGGRSIRHRFTRQGSFRVFASVTGSLDSGGESQPVTVTVGKPRANGHTGSGKRKQAGAGTGSGQGRGTATGVGAGGGGVGGSSAGGVGSPGSRQGAPAADRSPGVASSGPLETVDGILVGAPTQVAGTVAGAKLLEALGGPPGGQSGSAGAPADETESSSRLSVVWSALGLAILFGLGAGWESRGRLEARRR